jgi:hypothetical protein
MYLIILALLWVALLTPTVVRRIRDNRGERSIASFHTEHEVLSRQGYVVPPAHRLDETEVDDYVTYEGRRPRLTVVHDDDTYGMLESRGSWDEWSQDYDYDGEPRPTRQTEPSNRYAAAYSSTPTDHSVQATYEPPIRRSMRSRRRVMFTRLVAASIILSVLAYFVSYSILTDVAVLAWVMVAGFIALALLAVSQGYLHESSLPVHLPQRRGIASVQPLYDEYTAPPEGFDSEYYEPDDDQQWQRESMSRKAFG